MKLFEQKAGLFDPSSIYITLQRMYFENMFLIDAVLCVILY